MYFLSSRIKWIYSVTSFFNFTKVIIPSVKLINYFKSKFTLMKWRNLHQHTKKGGLLNVKLILKLLMVKWFSKVCLIFILNVA